MGSVSKGVHGGQPSSEELAAGKYKSGASCLIRQTCLQMKSAP